MIRNWLQEIPTSEAYWINRVLYDTQHKPPEMERFRTDPDGYMDQLPISPKAKQHIRENQIGPLYLAGANPYLLRAHCLSLGVPEAVYLQALREAGENMERG